MNLDQNTLNELISKLKKWWNGETNYRDRKGVVIKIINDLDLVAGHVQRICNNKKYMQNGFGTDIISWGTLLVYNICTCQM